MPTSPTSKTVDIQDADAVASLLRRAAERNLELDARTGSVVDLPAEGHLLVTGDMHDHRVNFRKALKIANLAGKPGNHLVLQELIHSERLVNGRDLSYRMLVEAASLQACFPGRVHVLMSNHELSQVRGEDISKNGNSCVEAFDHGLDFVFDEEADGVRDAIREYVESLPLAVRCENGVMVAHSLPSSRKRAHFDPTVLSRVPTEVDMAGPRGSAHLMVWGRAHAQNWADDLAAFWKVDTFVLGHQHADMGYDCVGETMLILNSDHQHGVVLPVDLSADYDRDELAGSVYPLAAMADA